ncbi:hypothetical protein EVAR_75836_1 [Eumeta japonica]|uniref:Uncharacterized protein n=1 Tax=Eumeta variegata TaxID=151549 RepID=A0A4C1TD81_EUMVA|nr:hypothetical protein EVAR_75836_1 [Eumeta japonica]
MATEPFTEHGRICSWLVFYFKNPDKAEGAPVRGGYFGPIVGRALVKYKLYHYIFTTLTNVNFPKRLPPLPFRQSCLLSHEEPAYALELAGDAAAVAARVVSVRPGLFTYTRIPLDAACSPPARRPIHLARPAILVVKLFTFRI